MQAEDKTSATSEVTSLWDDYQNGLAYQANSGLSKNIPKFVKFYEGDQWAPPTKNTKNLPRPVVNIIKMICRNKKSAILSTPVKITYSAEDSTVNVDKFNKFAEYIQNLAVFSIFTPFLSKICCKFCHNRVKCDIIEL